MSKCTFGLLRVVVIVSLIAAHVLEAEEHRFHRDHILGTSYDLTVVVDDPDIAQATEAAVIQEIERLTAILNLYDSESEISRLNRADAMIVSEDLFAVLKISEHWRKVTRNVFSARIGGLLDVWKRARKEGKLPDRPSLRVQADEIRSAKLVLNEDSREVTRPKEITFATDAVAKGYIIDKAFEVAESVAADASGILLDIGGDIRVLGAAAGGDPWTLGVSTPEIQNDSAAPVQAVALSVGAMATSGHTARSFEINEKKYSHIIDTKSGWPAPRMHSATVVSKNATTADLLATAFTAMNATTAINLAEDLPDVECLILDVDGRRYSSPGWADYSKPLPGKKTRDASLWPDGFSLILDYEIPKKKVSKYRAPYLSIWVTDADRNLVKTLIMLGDETRWMEENYVWWRRYARKESSLVDAMSQASRKPGRYQLIWDGYDDFGNPISQGEYTLNIEASREHGEHTLAKIELLIGGKKQRIRRKADGELGPIRIEYSKTEDREN
ncbi:DUF2271 domain-containing protein [Puniceicoccaceae bacterium K14]|nr:DUF2271 domain-containing protein [Puniceicoccaceae bacterium K14]